mgnify:CR=1 FL=1
MYGVKRVRNFSWAARSKWYPAEVKNQPKHIEALEICDESSVMSSIRQEVIELFSAITPKQIREQNERIIETLDCLRLKGWNFEDSLPDENGALI